MKAETLEPTSSRWPAAVALPLYDPARDRLADGAPMRPPQASVGPIELRIDGSDGPSAIAILE